MVSARLSAVWGIRVNSRQKSELSCGRTTTTSTRIVKEPLKSPVPANILLHCLPICETALNGTSGLGRLISGNTATNSCPGHLCQQYAFDGVSVRRDPTTLRERRCHNCRPTKMTCSPVNFGRVDTTNLAQFAYSRTESNYTGRSFTPREQERKPIPKCRSRPLSNGCALASSGLIRTSASRLLSRGRRGLNLTWLGSATPR